MKKLKSTFDKILLIAFGVAGGLAIILMAYVLITQLF